jgi:hypothetical protein
LSVSLLFLHLIESNFEKLLSLARFASQKK